MQAQAFLGAPPVSVLTPPAGNRLDTPFSGPATQAWDAFVDAPELEVLETFWQEDQGDVEYSALLEEFDVAPAPSPAPVRSRPGKPHPNMPHPGMPHIGRRRGGSKDHRLWIGLGGVVIVAAAAIFGIVKFEFPPAGQAHTFTTPAKIDGCYIRSASIAKSAGLGALTRKMVQQSGGTDPVSAAYESSCGSASAPTQIVSVLEAHLANDSPSSSIRAFQQSYPDAKVVGAGSLGGEAACEETGAGTSSSVSMCVWFDDDSFGALISSTMDANLLSTTMLNFRPAVELTAK